MEISIGEKIKIVAKRKKIRLSELAAKSGQTIQNLSNKLRSNNMRESDLNDVAALLNCDLKIILVDKETGEEY